MLPKYICFAVSACFVLRSCRFAILGSSPMRALGGELPHQRSTGWACWRKLAGHAGHEALGRSRLRYPGRRNNNNNNNSNRAEFCGAAAQRCSDGGCSKLGRRRRRRSRRAASERGAHRGDSDLRRTRGVREGPQAVEGVRTSSDPSAGLSMDPTMRRTTRDGTASSLGRTRAAMVWHPARRRPDAPSMASTAGRIRRRGRGRRRRLRRQPSSWWPFSP